MYSLYIYIYIIICNRAPWKNKVIELFTVYEYIWNNKKSSYVLSSHWIHVKHLPICLGVSSLAAGKSYDYIAINGKGAVMGNGFIFTK